MGIMEVFESFPNEELASQDFYRIARSRGIFVPPAFNTHLSQLAESGALVKTRRAVYKYVPPVKIEPEEIPMFKGTTEALDQLTLC